MTQPAAFSLAAAGRQALRFLRDVAGRYRAFHAIVGLTLVLLVLEYLATSLMIPLAGSSGGGVAQRFWLAAAERFGFEPTTRMWLWLFFVLMALRLALGWVQNVATTMLGKRVHRAMSDRVFRHVLAGEPLTQIYARSVGHYITLAGDDTFRCGTLISSVLQVGVGLATALVAMAVLHQFSPGFFWGLLAFLALCTLVIGALLRQLVRLNVAGTALSRELNTAFIESLNSLRSIRALAGERVVGDSYADQIGRYTRQLLRAEALKAAIRSFPAVLLLLCAAWLTRPGATLGGTEAGLFAVTVIVIRVFSSLGQMIAAGMLLLTDLRAFHDIGAIIDLPADEPVGPGVLPTRPVPVTAAAPMVRIERVELRGVAFGYAGRPMILHEANHVFVRGKTYAITGPSGTGKSTLADLLLGLLTPQAGEVLVNDAPAAAFVHRARMLLVEQQPRIFSTTLRDNLLFGAEASDDALWRALEMVDLHEAVRAMPRGLDTAIAYQGENFSGGQRQRIGIARALVRQPDVLVLDEATSALDTRTREIVLENVRKMMRDGILLFITHDPAVEAIADTVVALQAVAPVAADASVPRSAETVAS